VRKVEIHVFPDKTSGSKSFKVSFAGTVIAVLCVVLAIIGFFIFAPSKISDNISDGNVMAVYRQNKIIKKEIKGIRASVDESILKAEENRILRDSTLNLGGLGFTLEENSGKALLHIINDILDYSKITSGKMDIFDDEYDLSSVIHDIAGIMSNRLQEKEDKVRLIVDVDPLLPARVIGDGPRIRQIIINLANNAVKFTNEGFVKIVVSFRKTDETSMILKVSVTDTGIGIRSRDLEKIFNSFTQVDSKRNRNVEGTGLGLAIVNQLVTLMGGTINVESKYESGSTFSFEVPQKVPDFKPITRIKNPRAYAVGSLLSDTELTKQMCANCDRLEIPVQPLSTFTGKNNSFDYWLEEHADKECFLFIDPQTSSKEIHEKLASDDSRYERLHVILVAGAFENESDWDSKLYRRVLRQPLLSTDLARMLENYEDIHPAVPQAEEETENFVAPSATVLVVDDNRVNLKVAEKLLSTFGVQVHKANSGKEALDMIVTTNYDIIFMDHMMPELDGIDTTRIIRRFHPKMNSIPIIALTANAVDEARKMFIDEGMNDFIAKPIELKVLKLKLKKWLPQSKIEQA